MVSPCLHCYCLGCGASNFDKTSAESILWSALPCIAPICVCSCLCVSVCCLCAPGSNTGRNLYTKGHHDSHCLSAIEVDTPTEPFVVCQDSNADSVDVSFTARTSNGDLIKVPETITASDGRVCTAQGSTNQRESATAAALVVMIILYPCRYSAPTNETGLRAG